MKATLALRGNNMNAEQPMTFQCMAAMMDILGTSNILCSGNVETVNKYIRNLEWIYDKASDVFDVNICTFSDNILAHTNKISSDDLSNLIVSLAQLQYDITCNSHLLVRGGVARGGLYHNRDKSKYDFVTGDVVVSAHNIESKIAQYPRIVIDNQLLSDSHDSIDDFFIIHENNLAYINYLNIAFTEEFFDEGMIDAHRSALIEHIRQNKMIDTDPESWNRIVDKDRWALMYHNKFCIANHLDYAIRFDVKHDSINSKDIIEIKEVEDQ